MASKQKLKRKLFDQGVAAAIAVFGTKDTYICPLCGGEYAIEALANKALTLEHVPPESQGGKEIILTCKPCNNTAGYTVDANAAGRSELNRFTEVISGEAGNAGPTVLTIGEHKVRAETSNDQGTTAFNIVGAANNPTTVEKAMNELRHAAEDGSLEGFDIQVTKRVRYNPRKARISDLRAAFLACTAKFGYRFAFSPALNAVRQQLLSPDKELVPILCFKPDDPVSAPAMSISSEKGLVLVHLGPHGIVLPWPEEDSGFDNAVAEGDKGAKVTFQVTALEWPRSFVAILDRPETNVR